jgi:hypothetical protein
MQQIKLCTTEVPNMRAVYERLSANQDHTQHVHVLHICKKIYWNVSIILKFQNKEKLWKLQKIIFWQEFENHKPVKEHRLTHMYTFTYVYCTCGGREEVFYSTTIIGIGIRHQNRLILIPSELFILKICPFHFI